MKRLVRFDKSNKISINLFKKYFDHHLTMMLENGVIPWYEKNSNSLEWMKQHIKNDVFTIIIQSKNFMLTEMINKKYETSNDMPNKSSIYVIFIIIIYYNFGLFI
jgi:hypothetical protein